jgi:exosortase D (VPLPA-CTERM-specific)
MLLVRVSLPSGRLKTMSNKERLQENGQKNLIRWNFGSIHVALAIGFIGLFALAFRDGNIELLRLWSTKEEYSHAYLLPVLALFLFWQRKNELAGTAWRGAWLGTAVTVFGLLLYAVGTLSTIYAVIHYALVITIGGVLWSYAGTSNIRYLWAGFVLLFFAIPFPQFLYQALSTYLQLVSSELGVAVIRGLGVSVFLEGNVIDLGSFKLQVVEACNGLRYLFPLASFGFLCSYLYRGPIWHKIVIFLSTVPITVFMNSLRIGIIGYTVDRWGQEMAEGFLHDFEGWAIFMACLGVLFLEMTLLASVQRPRARFADVFYVEMPSPAPKDAQIFRQPIPAAFLASGALVVLATIMSFAVSARQELVPPRKNFEEFPLKISTWSGAPEPMEQVYIDALKFTDYTIVNYRRANEVSLVNFYVAYYASQRAGESAHSPRSCLPGGGWKIESLKQLVLADLPSKGVSQAVNRAQIAMGENKQLVYYWFQQRGRVITNEYLVKWYLLVDSIFKNRSDGALVRVTTFVPPGESWEDGDARLEAFLRDLGPRLEAYVPN